jgi:hypothetical protein
MPIVRTTMRPDQPIEVDAIEALDLQRLGLLVDDPAPAVPAAPAATPAAPDKKPPSTAKTS